MENNNEYQRNPQALLELINKEFLDSKGRLNSNKIKQTPEILNAIYEFTDKIPNKEKIKLRDLIWCIKNGFNEVPKCKTCGKEIPLKIEWANRKYPQGYIRKYCSLKCFNNDPEIKAKASEREKVRAKERLKKRKKTIEEKYGSWENRPGKDNFKKANEKLKKDPEFRQKRKEKTISTNLEKYGTEWPTQTQEIKEKRKQTSLEKYGIEHWFKLDKFKEKRKQTMLQKYGVEFLAQLEDFKKYLKEKQYENLEQQGYKNLDKLNASFVKEHFFNNKNEFLKNKFLEFYNFKAHSTAYNFLKKFEIDWQKRNGTSNLEKEVVDYIKSFYEGEVIENDRQTIAPLELDIFVPEKKVAIEFDGLYWHSFNDKSLVNEFKYKHLIKTVKAEEKGINLLHIFENEWINPLKRDIWKSVIGYKLGYVKKRYYARKLKITKVDNKFASKFFYENHLQGGAAVGSYRFALYDPKTGEIISIMTFSKPRYNKEIEYELIRFASLKYTACVGCAQKLFKYFIKNYDPKSIVSYANRRWASKHSNLYKTLGFKFVGEAEPNYFYFKLDDPELRMYPRVTFQKHKLKDHPATKDYFNSDLTETEIMFNAGFRRIYDCGNLVFHWIKGETNV